MPRIIVLPEFIASQNIHFDVKEFYRKSSNTFLRLDINRNKRFQQSLSFQKSIN